MEDVEISAMESESSKTAVFERENSEALPLSSVSMTGD
jgi:hypothetical protein